MERRGAEGGDAQEVEEGAGGEEVGGGEGREGACGGEDGEEEEVVLFLSRALFFFFWCDGVVVAFYLTLSCSVPLSTLRYPLPSLVPTLFVALWCRFVQP